MKTLQPLYRFSPSTQEKFFSPQPVAWHWLPTFAPFHLKRKIIGSWMAFGDPFQANSENISRVLFVDYEVVIIPFFALLLARGHALKELSVLIGDLARVLPCQKIINRVLGVSIVVSFQCADLDVTEETCYLDIIPKPVVTTVLLRGSHFPFAGLFQFPNYFFFPYSRGHTTIQILLILRQFNPFQVFDSFLYRYWNQLIITGALARLRCVNNSLRSQTKPNLPQSTELRCVTARSRSTPALGNKASTEPS